MKTLKKFLLLILIIITIIGVYIGGTFLVYEIRCTYNINQMKKENEIFYELLEEADIDVDGYFLYEAVFHIDDEYYIVFTEGDNSTAAEDGNVVNGILITLSAEIEDLDYRSDISLEQEEGYYILPALWIAGGGTALATTQAFHRRAEIRKSLVECSTEISVRTIDILIEGDHCLGKIEF